MPLEIPKSPVQHPHHRASGFSIPGRLPCLLAVVLGLFAHQGALAQTFNSPLVSLALSDAETGTTVNLVDGTVEGTFMAEDVVFGVTQVTVAVTLDAGWEPTYQGAADAVFGYRVRD